MLAVVCIVAASCGGSPSKKVGVFRVAVLLTGPVSDDGWNASAWEGLELIAVELGAEISKLESLDKSQFEESLREFGAQGFDLVFGHAYEFQDATLRVAEDFPGTMFVVVAGNQAAANVGAVHFKLEDATYPLGALAAKLSRDNLAGMIGGEEIPSLVPGFRGFENGAKSVRPEFRVETKYVGNWHDVALGREHAEALFERGAKFVFQNADKAGLGVFQAAQEHRGQWAFGSNKNQNDVLEGSVFASAVLNVPRAYLQIAEEVRAGRYRPAATTMGMRDGVVSVVLGSEAKRVMKDEEIAWLREIEGRITSGEIDPLAGVVD